MQSSASWVFFVSFAVVNLFVHYAFSGSSSNMVVLPELPPCETGTSLKSATPEFEKCDTNPYAFSLGDSMDVVYSNGQTHLENMTDHYMDIRERSRGEYTRLRFDIWSPVSTCDYECVQDKCGVGEAKHICGLSVLKESKAPCVIYSVGSNNQWGFEQSMLSETACEIHTFDCTGNEARFKPPKTDRLHFHYVCAGKEAAAANPGIKMGVTKTVPQIMKDLGHTTVHLMKMDIEGYEWGVFEGFADQPTNLPMQILVEVHYRTQMLALDPTFHAWVIPNIDFKMEWDFRDAYARLLKLGYGVVDRHVGGMKHCMEFTMIRFAC